jgi:demethylmenaquinone methyltransferase / 2-methoxy-6-polyprenyl-1,4-benzoquinol methylase
LLPHLPKYAGRRVPETEYSTGAVRGAAPKGTSDPESASRAVREMFTSIAPRYDFLNHLLSANIDKLWWRRTARMFSPVLFGDSSRVLDLCCGTGDMAFALRRQGQQASIIGADFSHAMLQLAAAKTTRDKPVTWIESDALQLPFSDNSFDLVTSAFGFRNLADYDAGLREILRVLKSGAEFAMLECGKPKGIFGRFYDIYFEGFVPWMGTLISGVKGAYAYLPDSVDRFPAPPEMVSRMRNAGFREVSWTPYTFGIAGLFRGKKP